jgi:hypothetical protein
VLHRTILTIETAGGETVGLASLGRRLWGGALVVDRLELRPGVSWAAALPSLLRGLAAIAASHAGEGGPFASISLRLGAEHPAYAALPDRQPRVERPYAWYLRVPDLAAFVARVRPALEARLADSPAAGHSGELTLGFYRGGLRIALEGGRLTAAENTPPTERARTDALFPDLTFLQLLFAHRSLEELSDVFPDCIPRTPAGRALLNGLFPRKLSSVWPIG